MKKLQPRRAWRRWRFRRNARRALILLARLDLFMKAWGWPEWKRKQFWHDFITSPRARAGQIAIIAAMIGKKPKIKQRPIPAPQAAKAPGTAAPVPPAGIPALQTQEVKNG